MPGFLLFHVRQRRGHAVENALDVDVDRPFPIVDCKALKRRARHNPRVVDHDIDTAKLLHGGIDQFLNLVTVSDVCGNSDCLSAVAIQFISQ